MNDMNKKKLYVWRLASFLYDHQMTMSGEELAAHLNRNKFLTSYGEEYEGTRGTYTLIRNTWRWVNDELGLNDEAEKVARAFVKPEGSYAYE
ncbi:MAG: hypothetical protein OXM01_12810 [Gemmatimonadota bacterium]|nr:hypothetical protein [Gemmatimonadota bacterium]